MLNEIDKNGLKIITYVLEDKRLNVRKNIMDTAFSYNESIELQRKSLEGT